MHLSRDPRDQSLQVRRKSLLSGDQLGGTRRRPAEKTSAGEGNKINIECICKSNRGSVCMRLIPSVVSKYLLSTHRSLVNTLLGIRNAMMDKIGSTPERIESLQRKHAR